MPRVTTEIVKNYVQEHISSFHSARLAGLNSIKLKNILQRKNPYLFRAKNLECAHDLVKTLLDAHLSSQEETLFGNFLEKLVIFVNGKAYSGQKSSARGIDLEFNKKSIRYIVSIKSGPNWGNNSQIERMVQNFDTAKKILRQGNQSLQVEAINGCCYGKDKKPEKRGYLKYCGQEFWQFISGDSHLYTKIIIPLGHQAREKNEQFVKDYTQTVNRFSAVFMKDFCNRQGEIQWKELVRFNSEKK